MQEVFRAGYCCESYQHDCKYLISCSASGTTQYITVTSNTTWLIEHQTGTMYSVTKNGNTLTTFDKVCDIGTYTLCDADFNEVVSYEGYVPKMLDRQGDGYGDYLQFTINDKGYIENWDVSFRDFDCEWVS